MKLCRPFSFLSLTFVLLAILAASMCVTRFWTKIPYYGSDIRLRMNECQCVYSGANPKDVFDETLEYPPFHKMGPGPADHARFNKPVDVYTPWEYTLMMPLSFLPEPMGETIWFLIIVSAVALLGFLAYRCGKSIHGLASEGRFTAALALAMPIAVYCDAVCGNFACTITAGLALMALTLNRGHDLVAGFALAFAMFKPQYGVLVALALLMRRKYRTVAIGAIVCIVAALPAAYWSHTSPIELILQSTQGGGSGVLFSRGCDILPYPAMPLLAATGIPKILLIGFPALIGALLCMFFTRRLREENDWLLILVPAATLATCWTYTTPGSRMLNWFLLLAIARTVIRCPNKARPLPIVLLLFANLRPFECLHSFLVMSSGVLADYQLSQLAVIIGQTIENEFAFCVTLYWLWQVTDRELFSART